MMPTTVTTITHYSSSLIVFSACIMSSEQLNFFVSILSFLFYFARARGDSSAAYLFAGLANGQLAVFDPCVIQVPFHTL